MRRMNLSRRYSVQTVDYLASSKFLACPIADSRDFLALNNEGHLQII
jgi:hypothetical protein